MEARATGSFAGFEEADYRIFDIQDFAGRMAAIRARISPKLALLGEALAERLTNSTRELFFAHVAKHARRTVNPPPETWVAFGRDPRKYKPHAHLAIVVSRRGVDARLVLKEEALDKRTFADALVRERRRLEAFLAGMPTLAWHGPVPGQPARNAAGAPTPVAELPAGFWDDLAEALRTRKTAGVDLGFAFPKEAKRLGPSDFQEFALRALLTLEPLYRIAVTPGARLSRGGPPRGR